MKSTMKSTFAIIAVALMVLVAVVPMVGVFSSDSDAATYYDPAEAAEDQITIKVKVYNADGTSVTSGIYAKAVWGSNAQYYKMVQVTSAETDLVITESEATNVKVYVSNATGKVNDQYSVASLGKLVKDTTYTALLTKGYSAESTFTLNVADSATGVYGTFGIKEGGSITVNYTLFAENGTTSLYTGTATMDANSQFKVSYPADKAVAKIKVTGLSVKETSTSSAETKNVTTAVTAYTTTSLKTEQYLLKVQFGAMKVPNGSFTLNSAKYVVETVEKATATFFPAGTTTVKSNTASQVINYYYTCNFENAPVGVTNLTGSLSWGSVTYQYAATATTDSGITTAAELSALEKVYYGTFKMGDISAYDSQSLSISEVNDSGAVTKTLTVKVADGCYVTTATSDTAQKLKVVASPFALTGIGNASVGADGITSAAVTLGNADITVNTTPETGVKYKLVNGTIIQADNTSAIDKSLNVTISGVTSAFGYPVSAGKVTVPTTAAGYFSVYIQELDQITIAPATGEYWTFASPSSSGPYIVADATAALGNLAIAAKDLSFKFVNGDGNEIVTPVTLSFPTTSIIYKALGAATANTSYSATTELHTITINKAYYNFDEATFYIDSDSYSYTATSPAKYKENSSGYMDVSSLDKKYTIVFIDSNGNTVPSTGEEYKFTAKLYNVFESESGAIVYTNVQKNAADVVYTASLDANGNTVFTFPSSYANKTIPKATDGAKMVLIEPTANASAYLLEKYYVFTTDGSSSTMTIVAATDSLTATVFKKNETTPLAGVKVDLYYNKDSTETATIITAGTLKDTAITDSDGEFTVLSDLEITNHMAFKFTLEGSTIDSASAVSAGEKVDEFYASEDAYVITITDLDDKVYKASANDKLTLTTGVETTATVLGGYAFTITAGLDAGMVITPTLTNGLTIVRTFGQYTITEEDVATGIIGFTSKQATYTVYLKDSEGAVINEGAVKAYMVKDGVKVGADIAFDPADATYGKTSKVLTEPTAADEEYVVKVADGASYKYYDVEYKFTDKTVTIESRFTTVYFGITDAAGVPLDLSAFNTEGLQVKNSTDTLNIAGNAVGSNMLYFIGDADATYKPTAVWTVATNYHVATTSAIEDGVVAANEQEITFSVVDANLEAKFVGGNVTINAYDAYGKLVEGFAIAGAIDANSEISAVRVVGDYVYAITGAGIAGYTFDKTSTTAFVANEGTYEANFITANGYDIDDMDNYDIIAYDDNGAIVSVGDEGGIIVDIENVALYKVEDLDEKWVFLPSETLNFVATETYITGTVPYTGKVDNGVVAIELYLDGDFVKEYRSDVVGSPIAVNKYDYVAYIDLTGYISDTAGVVFDSILAVYYENGAEIASSAVNPYTAVNNIVSPIIETYEAVLLPPSVLIASHVGIDQIGDVVTVTADANFMIADDEGVYTDGQYTYTFAGWYVNNQKVSTSPVYTFELTDNVVISPQYTVTYEKTSDANDKQTPQPQPVQPDNSIDTNVLIIGICAVIVALIAVVYAVIKKE